MNRCDLTALVDDSLYIDAHCHAEQYEEEILFREVEENSLICLSSSSDPDSIRRNRELYKHCPRILDAAGIHPWQAGRYGPEDLEPLLPYYREALQISEIGLDGKWAPPEADDRRQESLFKAQLELALLEGKPVTLHTKDAEDRILEYLRKSCPPSVLIHWFDGSDSQLEAFIDLDCFFSISPALIGSRRHQEIALRIPRNRLLAETDNPTTWPWLFYTPARPMQISRIYREIFTLFKLPEEEGIKMFRLNLMAFLLAL